MALYRCRTRVADLGLRDSQPCRNGRWSWFPLASYLLLYNWILTRGYDNFLLGAGLCLWAWPCMWRFAIPRSCGSWRRLAASL